MLTLVCPIIGASGPNDRKADRPFRNPANFRTHRLPVVGTSRLYLAGVPLKKKKSQSGPQSGPRSGPRAVPRHIGRAP